MYANCWGGGRYDKDILSKTLIVGPNEICSESYTIFKKIFNTKDEAKLFSYFLESRFLRFMVSIFKITQHATREKYRFVPYVDVVKDLKKWQLIKDENERRDALDNELMDYFELSKEQKKLIFNSVNIINNKSDRFILNENYEDDEYESEI